MRSSTVARNNGTRDDAAANVGSRTTRERGARGDGIYIYEVDSQKVNWKPIQTVGDLVNPSFLAFDRNHQFLFAVHGDQTEISSFRINQRSGNLTAINKVSTGGKNPVHLSISPNNRFIVIANHISSSLAVVPFDQNGVLGEITNLVTLTGKIGPHRVEQPFPKPHEVQFDRTSRFIVVPDKGLDRIFVYRLDDTEGKLALVERPPVVAREGAGPRHITFHPSNAYAYVVT